MGIFAGWFINFQAVPNLVSTFHGSTDRLCKISLTFQGLVFPVAWFSVWRECPLCSLQTILWIALHFRPHLLGCLLFRYTLLPILKLGGVCSVVFCACLNLFLSKVSLAIASAKWCDLRSKHPDSGSPRNCCMGSSNCWGGEIGISSID